MTFYNVLFLCVAIVLGSAFFLVVILPIFQCSSCHQFNFPWKFFHHSESGGVSCQSCGPCMKRLYGWTDEQAGIKKVPPKDRYEILVENERVPF